MNRAMPSEGKGREFESHRGYHFGERLIMMEDRKRKDFGGFAISFISKHSSGIPMFNPDSEEGETAICIPDESKKFNMRYLILNGDYFDAYVKLAESGGLDACKKYFEDNINSVSSWSDSITD